MERPIANRGNRGLRCEEVNRAAQSRIREELVACLRCALLVWMCTQRRLRLQSRRQAVSALGRSNSEPLGVDSKIDWQATPANQLRVCYEAGPTGYIFYWQLT